MTSAVHLTATDMALIRELLADRDRTAAMAAAFTSPTDRSALYAARAQWARTVLDRLPLAAAAPPGIAPAAEAVTP